MLNLHWIASQPTPYTSALFSALAADAGIDLTVHYCSRSQASHPWRTPPNDSFRWRVFRKVFGIDGRLFRLAALDLKSQFIVGGWNDPTMAAVITIRGLRRSRFAVWADTPSGTDRPFLVRLVRNPWLAWIFGHATRVLAAGRPASDRLRAIGCPQEKIVNFPYWVPIPAIARRVEVRRPVKFVAIGRLEPVKRFDVVIEAMHLLGQRFGTGTATLRIAGEGSEKTRLLSLVRKYSLDAVVEFTGWLEHDQTMTLLTESDVLVHPADWEPYGVVVLEAMARGKPVIASDGTMAAADRVQNGINGFIARSGDAADFADRMAALTQDLEKVKGMGQIARTTAEKWPLELAVSMLKQVLG